MKDQSKIGVATTQEGREWFKVRSERLGIYSKCNRNHLGFILNAIGREVMIRSDILVHLMQIILGAVCKMESRSYWRELDIPLEMIMVVACIRVIVPSGIFTHADNLM